MIKRAVGIIVILSGGLVLFAQRTAPGHAVPPTSTKLQAPPGKRMDCTARNPRCTPVTIQGDPMPRIKGYGLAPFRGYGDPSIRKDPNNKRLWMTYSYCFNQVIPPTIPLLTKPTVDNAVETHLAQSDDQGKSWRFVRKLHPSKPMTDPGPKGGRGYSIHEVSTLVATSWRAPFAWGLMHFGYFEPAGKEKRRFRSFHLQLNLASHPQKLGAGKRSRLGGPFVAPTWGIETDLSSLHPGLSACVAWTEPSLWAEDNKLYLIAQCLVVDLRSKQRQPQKEFLGVFSTKAPDKQRRLRWRWEGKLTTARDAHWLGGDVLTQADLSWSRKRPGKGRSRLLLVTPKRLKKRPQHQGCRVLEVSSLSPPRLRCRKDGAPILRAAVRSSDSNGIGPGLCAYEPTSTTGLLFVRTEVRKHPPKALFDLRATHLHP